MFEVLKVFSVPGARLATGIPLRGRAYYWPVTASQHPQQIIFRAVPRRVFRASPSVARMPCFAAAARFCKSEIASPSKKNRERKCCFAHTTRRHFATSKSPGTPTRALLPHHLDLGEASLADLEQPCRARLDRQLEVFDFFAFDTDCALLNQAIRGRRAFHQTRLLQ